MGEVIPVLFLTICLPLWIIFHYVTKWKMSKGLSTEDEKMLSEFRRKHEEQLALDGGGYLTYLAPTRANLSLIEDRWPDIKFSKTREH